MKSRSGSVHGNPERGNQEVNKVASIITVNPGFCVPGSTVNMTEPDCDQPRSGFGSITGAGAGGAGSSFGVLLQAATPRRPTTRRRAEIFLNAFFIFRHPFESVLKNWLLVRTAMISMHDSQHHPHDIICATGTNIRSSGQTVNFNHRISKSLRQIYAVARHQDAVVHHRHI